MIEKTPEAGCESAGTDAGTREILRAQDCAQSCDRRVRRGQVVPIDAVADLDALGIAIDAPGPDRSVMAREQLRRLQTALDKLPPRVRQVV